ncbi:MAG: FHA domain-containing protein, partial [Nitrospirota bacterium]
MINTVDETVLAIPYRGVHPFRYIDRQYFFGREAVVEELLVDVILYRLVLLFGESGAGKSSVINAGLIPELEKKDFHAERLRVNPADTNQPIWIESIQASEDQDRLFLPSIFDSVPSTSSHVDERIPCSIESFLDAIYEKAEERHPVLIFDQFEELFTLFGSRDNDEETGKTLLAKEKIIQSIFKLANDTTLKVKLVIIIREDFLGNLETFSKQYPQIFDHYARLGHLDRDGAKKAIIGPFENGTSFPSKLTGSLADIIVRELSRDNVHGQVHATQLQIVCDRLWRKYAFKLSKITENEFAVEGRVRGLLEGYLTSELESLGPARKSLATRVLGSLITDEETRDIVSDDKLKGLLNAQKRNETEALEQILIFLEAHKIINRTTQRKINYYEITSEYLITPIKIEKECLSVNVKLQSQYRRWLIAFVTTILIFTVSSLTYIAYSNWIEVRPWGYLTMLSNGKVFQLTDHLISVGRNTKDDRYKIGLGSRDISRMHMFLSQDLFAVDNRSLNGTTVNAIFLPYGDYEKPLQDGDLIVLAGIASFQFTGVAYEPLQFWTPSPKTHLRPLGWGIFIDGVNRSYTYFKSNQYFVDIENHRLTPHEN